MAQEHLGKLMNDLSLLSINGRDTVSTVELGTQLRDRKIQDLKKNGTLQEVGLSPIKS